MKRLLLSFVALVMSFAMIIPEAEAKRLGGSKSFGMQRDATPSKPASPPPRTADSPAPAAGAAAAGQAAKKNSWLGPVAGLAAGLGLAALASHLGFGEEFANMLLIGLLVIGAVLVFKLVMRKRQAGPQMQYAGMGAGGGSGAIPAPAMPRESIAPAGSSAAPASAATPDFTPSRASIPADFDAEGFLRQAKLNFLRLQAANDSGNLNDLREFTTPDVFAELQMQISERGATPQSTEVMDLKGEVLEVAEEPGRYVVSVRFHGLIRESSDALPEAFDEIWHLTKATEGNRGWAVAGIQQVS